MRRTVLDPPIFDANFDIFRYRESRMIELYLTNKINEQVPKYIAISHAKEDCDVDINIYDRLTNEFKGSVEVIDAGSFGDTLYLPARKAVAKDKHLILWFYKYVTQDHPEGEIGIYPSKRLMESNFLSPAQNSVNGRPDKYHTLPKLKIKINGDLKTIFEKYFK